MANKSIRTDAPDTVAGVERRAEAIKKDSPSREGDFDGLCLDTLVGIAEAGKEGCRSPDNPVDVARAVMRIGAELYDDPDAWLTWQPNPKEGADAERRN